MRPVSTDELFAVPYLRFLPEDHLAAMAARCSVRGFAGGEVIFEEGGPGDRFYVVRTGSVELVRTGPGGAEQVVDVVEPSGSFGEVAVFAHAPRAATARARTEAELIVVDGEHVERALDAVPMYARWVMQTLAADLTGMGARLSDLVHHLHEAAFLKFAQAAESYDRDTAHHIQRMSQYCAQLALAAGMSRADAHDLLLASKLHDVGKGEVDPAILTKPGKLTDDEFAAMKLHPVIGAMRLWDDAVPLFQTAARIAKTHHEKVDGRGYPDGLKGDRIPLEGRIAAVADVFDALTSRRPYKEPWPVERAVAQLEQDAGTHFDRELVGVFVGTLPEIERIRAHYPAGL